MTDRITIQDVARIAGVSETTVSHVFSGNRPVSKETSKRVKAAARELDYRPNAVATSLRKQRTNTAMIIIPDITNPYYPMLSRGVQDVLRTADYSTILSNTDERPSDERAFLEEAVSRRLDGVVFTGFSVSLPELAEYAAGGMAIVNLGAGLPGSMVDSVSIDDRAGASDAVAYLLRSRGGDVAMINGVSSAPVTAARLAGYMDAHEQADRLVRSDLIVMADFTIAGGRAGMRHLLSLADPPAAVFCANDLIAIGALGAARERGLRLPEDIAIMGYDDIELASLVTPTLTTVRDDTRALGTAAGELLLSRMTGDRTRPGRHIAMKHTLTIRESA